MHKREDEVYAALVGIDWADKKHDVCLQAAGNAKRERLVLEHRPGAFRRGPRSCGSDSAAPRSRSAWS